MQYIPISDVPTDDKNVTFLIDITFPCDPEIYCPAVVNGSNTSYIACDRLANGSFGEADCVTTCDCCNVQIPTTTQVITTTDLFTTSKFETTSVGVVNIIAQLSDAISYWLLYQTVLVLLSNGKINYIHVPCREMN